MYLGYIANSFQGGYLIIDLYAKKKRKMIINDIILTMKLISKAF
jgi:hypothetical protein